MSRVWKAQAKLALANCNLELALKYLQRAQEIEDTPCLRTRINRIKKVIRRTEGPREESDASFTESDSAEIDSNQSTPKKRKRSYSTNTAKGSFVDSSVLVLTLFQPSENAPKKLSFSTPSFF